MLEIRSTYQKGSYWYYLPNKPAPIVFTILFLASGLMHIYQSRKYRSWKVTGLLPWSALLFVAGFVLRVMGAFGEWDNLPIFISSTVLLQAAPPVYEASNFLALGRILYYIPYLSPIHPGRVFSTFLAAGATIEVITANGASLSARTSNPKYKQDIGKVMIKVALILQLVLMMSLVLLALRFYYKCWKARLLTTRVKAVLNILLTSCGLITARTIYRVVEYFTAASLDVKNTKDLTPILMEEWYFWVFEASLMFLNTSMLNVFHVMHYLPHSNKIYLSKDGVTEIEGPGFEDKRPFIVAILDPFDLIGIITRQKRYKKYWEDGEPAATALVNSPQARGTSTPERTPQGA